MILYRSARRARVNALSALTLAVATTLSALVGLAAMATSSSAAPKTSGPCPNGTAISGFKEDANLGASFENSGSTTTYSFSVLAAESSIGGVPGLVKYCVYATPSGKPTAVPVNPNLEGADGSAWKSSAGTNNFAFMRPGGNRTNISLSLAETYAMGTATWSTLPTDQTILLHIADAGVCGALYPGTSASTCYVFPSTGPVCNDGTDNVAYNAMPFDVEDCGVPALGFEAQSTSEFGDRVALAGTSRTLDSLEVAFGSYACSVSGHWNTGDCVTVPGAVFTHPVTANIYAVNTSDPTLPGALLATTTATVTLPYRPSADAACTGTDVGKWFNAAAGFCQNSIIETLTFDSWDFQAGFSGTLPDDVIWTVAFNTSHAGYSPLGDCAAGPNPGCPYDSLNVGAKSFGNAPYAGTDTAEDVAFWSYAGNGNTLQVEVGWTGNRPLGRIVTTP
jgi:hypothetical protein